MGRGITISTNYVLENNNNLKDKKEICTEITSSSKYLGLGVTMGSN